MADAAPVVLASTPMESTNGAAASGNQDYQNSPPGSVVSQGTEAENQGKLKTLLGILRRFIGVADIASVRFSLPSQLLEPIPNLEYWNYLDRPETFTSIGDSEDELGRFLGVLRFWFTKDLKFIKGRPCKPYNSTLGEFFRCTWDVTEALPAPTHDSRPASIRSSTNSSTKSIHSPPIRVSFLTEQTSHHPPVSAFYIDCPAKGISAKGYDQISAKFTGTSIRVTPGVHNLGIFISLHNRDGESYRLTHPAAHLGGLLRGALAIYVEDICFVTCEKTKMRCILQYLGDGWLGRAKHRVEGVIYRYEGTEEDHYERIKDVPSKKILAKIDGSWMTQIYYTLTGSSEKHLLIDLDPLQIIPKTCPPREVQLSNESRRMWEAVTKAIHEKDYGKATILKQEIEERQRQKAAARQEKGEEWVPRFFEDMHQRVGKPELSDEGKKALEGLNKGDLKLQEWEER